VGAGGWAQGPEPHFATDKAYRLAYKNLYYFDLFDNHTIWHSATAYFGATKVRLIRCCASSRHRLLQG
jgi:ribosomal protein S5